MNNEKKELYQSIMLICLLALLTNYFLYFNVIRPRASYVENIDREIAQADKSRSYAESVLAEKKQIQVELQELETVADQYDLLFEDYLDTVNICYDFYIYLKNQGITGGMIRFSELEPVTELGEGILAEEDEMFPAGPGEEMFPDAMNADPGQVVGAEIGDPVSLERSLYRATVDLNLDMDKRQYYEFISNIGSITRNRLLVNQLSVEVTQEASEQMFEADSVLQGEIASFPMPLLEAREYLSVKVRFYIYLKSNLAPDDVVKKYEAYTKKKGLQSIEALF